MTDKYFGCKGKFERVIIDYCYTHPGEISDYHLKCFAEAAERKRTEKERWRHISMALKEIAK